MTRFILLSIGLLFFIGGFSQSKTSRKKLYKTNFISLYQENTFTDLNVEIFHSSDELSTVIMSIKLSDLLYLQNKKQNTKVASFKIHYELYESYESKTVIDTASFYYQDSTNFDTENEMITDFNIPANYPGDYLLYVTLTDLNRQEDNSVSRFYPVNKSNKNTSQYFKITDDNYISHFGRHIKEGQYFKIQCSNKEYDKLYIRYYNRALPVAKTPFATEKNITFKFDPDSLYNVSLIEGTSELLELPYPGIYHFQTDFNQVEGLTLYRFDEGFPEIESPLQAVLPLRYLTTQREFDQLLNYTDHKIAVDSFWLERATYQPERAKNMIARYYQRVQIANKLFTSYQEGWKTDQGIIYIIYGPPSEVYRKIGEEEWIYGERSNPMSIKFFFNQVINPFTPNDYSLQRSSSYKTSWYIAIENWRR